MNSIHYGMNSGGLGEYVLRSIAIWRGYSGITMGRSGFSIASSQPLAICATSSSGFTSLALGGFAFLLRCLHACDMSVLEFQQMPQAEKLRLMEALWMDLSREEQGLESPAWHATELTATAQRLADGQEEVMDWERAKAALRQGAA